MSADTFTRMQTRSITAAGKRKTEGDDAKSTTKRAKLDKRTSLTGPYKVQKKRTTQIGVSQSVVAKANSSLDSPLMKLSVELARRSINIQADPSPSTSRDTGLIGSLAGFPIAPFVAVGSCQNRLYSSHNLADICSLLATISKESLMTPE